MRLNIFLRFIFWVNWSRCFSYTFYGPTAAMLLEGYMTNQPNFSTFINYIEHIFLLTKNDRKKTQHYGNPHLSYENAFVYKEELSGLNINLFIDDKIEKYAFDLWFKKFGNI